MLIPLKDDIKCDFYAEKIIHYGVMLVKDRENLYDIIGEAFNYPTLHDLYKYAAYDGLGNPQATKSSFESHLFFGLPGQSLFLHFIKYGSLHQGQRFNISLEALSVAEDTSTKHPKSSDDNLERGAKSPESLSAR